MWGSCSNYITVVQVVHIHGKVLGIWEVGKRWVEREHAQTHTSLCERADMRERGYVWRARATERAKVCKEARGCEGVMGPGLVEIGVDHFNVTMDLHAR